MSTPFDLKSGQRRLRSTMRQPQRKKVLQTGWLRTTGIYSLTVPEDKYLQSRRWWGELLPEAPRENLPRLSPHFWWLLAVPAFLGWQIHRFNLCLHHLVASPCVSPCVSTWTLTGQHQERLRAHRNLLRPHLN